MSIRNKLGWCALDISCCLEALLHIRSGNCYSLCDTHLEWRLQHCLLSAWRVTFDAWHSHLSGCPAQPSWYRSGSSPACSCWSCRRIGFVPEEKRERNILFCLLASNLSPDSLWDVLACWHWKPWRISSECVMVKILMVLLQGLYVWRFCRPHSYQIQAQIPPFTNVGIVFVLFFLSDPHWLMSYLVLAYSTCVFNCCEPAACKMTN